MSKINKLGKSTFVIAILSFILVAVLAFGGTYAYFSDSTEMVNSNVTMGTLYLSETASHSDSNTLVTSGLVVPNQTIVNTTATTTVTTNIKYYVRIKLETTFTLSNVGLTEGKHTKEDGCLDADVEPIIFSITYNSKTINDQNTDWAIGTADANGVSYLYLLAAQEPQLTEGSNAAVPTHIALTISASVDPDVGKGESQHFMGATYTLGITVQVCQADYLQGAGPITDAASAAAAWDIVYDDTLPNAQG